MAKSSEKNLEFYKFTHAREIDPSLGTIAGMTEFIHGKIAECRVADSGVTFSFQNQAQIK